MACLSHRRRFSISHGCQAEGPTSTCLSSRRFVLISRLALLVDSCSVIRLGWESTISTMTPKRTSIDRPDPALLSLQSCAAVIGKNQYSRIMIEQGVLWLSSYRVTATMTRAGLRCTIGDVKQKRKDIRTETAARSA